MQPYFQKGGQTIYHGDCREILPALEAGSVDAVVTDPPFGIGFKYGDKTEVTSDPESYWQWLKPMHDECWRILRDGGFSAWWQAQLNFRHFWTWFGDDIHIYASCKSFVQMRKTPINYGYDPVVMTYKPGDVLKPKNPPRSIDYFVANSAAKISDPTRIEKGHPCPRQIDAVEEIVRNFTLPGGIVLDPFLGSGTTGVACLRTDRRLIGIEAEERWCEMAAQRLDGRAKARRGQNVMVFNDATA